MSIKAAVNKALAHLKMANPFHSLLRSGTSIFDAPSGSWALSKDPKTNMALWNAIYTSGPAFGLAYLINNLANQKAESEVEEAIDTQLIDKLQSLRPRLVADPNLADVSAYTELPKKELKRLEEIKAGLPKSAANNDDGAEDDQDFSERASDSTKELIKNSILNTIPLAAFGLAAAGGIALSNKNNKDRIAKNLQARRTQLRNIQALIDRQMLADRGLIKAAAKKEGDKTGSGVGVLDAFVGLPITAHMLLAAALGLGSYGILSDRDKNKATLKYLKKIQLGSNTLQDTPQLSVLDLPVSPDKILAVPGDKKQQTLIKAEISPTDDGVIDVVPIENSGILEELKAASDSEIESRKKKDALFA